MNTCKLFSFFLFFVLTGKVFSQSSGISFTTDETTVNSDNNSVFVSSSLNDATDPAIAKGIRFLIQQRKVNVPVNRYQLSAMSSYANVLSNDSIRIEKSDGGATVFFSPSGVGYTDVMLSLICEKEIKTITVHYAVSAASATPIQTTWHTGGSDASACVPVGNQNMLVADDELDNLCLYNRHQSGRPLSSFYYGDKLNLTDGTAPYFKEVDVEAGTSSLRVPNRTYWLGSMSNSAEYKIKPNRNRVFAVDVTDAGNKAHCSMMGYYDALRQQLINWGNDHGYKFGKSAASGQNSKEEHGFNVEAMVFAPDSNTLYIGFRAPLVPVTSRENALIAPVENFEAWFNNGKPKGNPVIGEPIELDLGGRGFRDMIRLSNGIYIILAGSPGDARTGAIYKWSGKAADTPLLLPGFDILHLNAEAVLEMDDANGNLLPDRLQVLSDNGTTVYYNDARPAKEFGQTAFRKFRSDIVISPQPALTRPK